MYHLSAKRLLCIGIALVVLLVCAAPGAVFAGGGAAANAPAGLDDLSTTDGSKPYPAAVASYCNTEGGKDKTAALTDGVIAYTEGIEGGGAVHNRWTNYGHTGATTDWVGVQFGVTQLVSDIDLEVYIDPDIPQITAPAMAPPVSIAVTYKNDKGEFVPATGVTANPAVPAAYLNTLTFDGVLTREIRVTLERPTGKYVGLTEMTVYGKKLAAYSEAEVNAALVSGGTTVTASHYYSSGSTSDGPQNAADGVIAYTDTNPRSRWALWNHRGTAEWINFDFGKAAGVNRAEIYVFTDKPSPGNTVEPASITVQYDENGVWKDVAVIHQAPAAVVGANMNGAGGHNVIVFEEVVTHQIRLQVQLQAGKSAALTEVELFGRYEEDTPVPTLPSTENLDNLALNTAGGGYPQVFVSVEPDQVTDNAAKLVDGIISGLQNLPNYDAGPRSRWTSYNNPNLVSTIGSRFKVPQTAEIVELYVYNDGGGCKLPSAVQLEYYDDAEAVWKPVTLTFVQENKTTVFDHPDSAGKVFRYLYAFESVTTSAVRVRLTPASGASLAVSELQIW
ncbi:MAG: discoidin domain-containing protein, partial [Oscillospiraceae bacterium]|nr:discoidin domain-containing protein [Oscillospiraceae bacterium]